MRILLISLLAAYPGLVCSQVAEVAIESAGSYADAKVEIVKKYGDVKWQVIEKCSGLADIKVQFVDRYADLKVEIVKSYGDRKICITNADDLDENLYKALFSKQ